MPKLHQIILPNALMRTLGRFCEGIEYCVRNCPMMDKIPKGLIAMLCVLSFGCMTTGKFTQTLSSNWGMSSSQIESKLKQKPVEEGYLYDSGIKFQRYRYFDAWTGPKDYILYFKNGGLVRYAPYTDANHYESMYELDIISLEQYRNYLNLRQKQLEYEIQMDTVRQQQEFQRQILQNQAEALNLQKEALEAQKKRDFRNSLDFDNDTTHCRPDGLGGFRCSSY